MATANPLVLRRLCGPLLVTVWLLLLGCQMRTEPSAVSTQATQAGDIAATDAVGTDVDLSAGASYTATKTSYPLVQLGLTNQRLDGNRVVDGYTDLSTITPIDVALDGKPAWVAAVPTEDGVLWGVVLEDGRTQAVLVADGTVISVPTSPAQLPAAMPPTLEYIDGVATFVVADGAVSPVTNAVPVGDSIITVGSDGDLIIEDPEQTSILDTDALPDARLLVDDDERVLFVSNPTERYPHGVLGDGVEAASITLAELTPEPHVVRTFDVPAPSVLEGIAPIWTDLNGDGVREIVVTLSDAVGGARVVAYAEDGSVVAQGPPAGHGDRWRHPIAVAPFGPLGELELAVILTPHIGGVVEFYTLEDRRLKIVATLPGFTSHVLGSRNLDMAVAADPSGEGQAVLLAPSQDRSHIGAIRHGTNGAETAWIIDVDGLIVTNVGAAGMDDDRLSVSVGRSDSTLRIWQPD